MCSVLCITENGNYRIYKYIYIYLKTILLLLIQCEIYF